MSATCDLFYPLQDGTSLENDIRRLENRLDVHLQYIQAIEGDVSRLEADNNYLKSEILRLEAQVNSNSFAIARVETETIANSTAILGLQGEIAALALALAAIGGLAALADWIQNMKLDNSSIKDKLKEHDKDITNLENTVTAINITDKLQTNEIISINNDIAEVNQEINNFNVWRDTLLINIDKMTDQIDGNNRQIILQLNDLTNEFNKLDPNKYNDDIVDLQNQINNIKIPTNKTDSLEKQINDLETIFTKTGDKYDQKINDIEIDLDKITKDLDAHKKTPIPDSHQFDFDLDSLKGEKGDQGEKGERGLMGLNGLDGKDGKDGKDAFIDTTKLKNDILEDLKTEMTPELKSINDKLDNIGNKTSETNTTVVTNIPAIDDGLKLLNEQTNIINNTTNNITNDITQLGIEIATIAAFTLNFSSNLLPTCRFHDDPYSAAIKSDTEIIKNQNIATQTGVATNIGLTQGVQNTVNTINTKAGTLINNGGIGGAFSRLYDTLQIDRMLNVITCAATIHNAFMLSADLGQTLMSMIDAVMQSMGLNFKNVEGQTVGISDVISSSIENFIKGIVGAENYAQIKLEVAQFNRIYQATMNSIYALNDIIDASRQITEIAAENTGKIGNALKKSGVINENSYGFMTENISGLTEDNPRWAKFQTNVESTENKLLAITTVAQAIVSISDNLVDLKSNRDEIRTALKDYQEPYGANPSNTKGDSDLNESKLDSDSPDTLINAELLGNKFSIVGN